MTSRKTCRRIAVLAALAVLQSGCAAIKTGSYVDESADFQTYQSFSWIGTQPYVPAEGSSAINPLARTMIDNAIRDELQQQGFAFTTDREAADFLVAYTVGSRDKVRIESYPVSYRGHWGWHTPHSHYYFRKIEARNYTEGTLGVDLFDNETGRPVWHGWAQKTVTEQDRADPAPTIKAGIAKLFVAFPGHSSIPN